MMRRLLTLACTAGIVSLSLACSGCDNPGGGGQAARSPAPLLSSQPGGGFAPQAVSSCPARVFSRMTEAQRVGQLFLVGIAGDPGSAAGAIAAYHFGSLLFGLDKTGVAGIRRTTRAIQSLASSRATSRVRFFIAANQEGGEVQALQGPGFSPIPPALAQGELSPPALEEEAASWGRELRAAGVNLDLAPVMDVVPPGTASQNQPIGVLKREFGDNPATAAAHGAAFIRGMRQAGIATAAKHFPGLGRVLGNTDFATGITDTRTAPDDAYLLSFRAAVEAGVPFVMVSLATYTRIDPRHLAAFSPQVMRVLLRQQLRFRGVIISDDLGAAHAVAAMSPQARAIGFVADGGDMITSQTLAAAVVMDHAILGRAAVDSAFRAVVHSAVMRVLTAKQAYGLLPCPRQ